MKRRSLLHGLLHVHDGRLETVEVGGSAVKVISATSNFRRRTRPVGALKLQGEFASLRVRFGAERRGRAEPELSTSGARER